jgi:hypothetical protein
VAGVEKEATMAASRKPTSFTIDQVSNKLAAAGGGK